MNIRISPEELRAAANFVAQKQESINSEVAALKAKIDEVCDNWEGAAQSGFIGVFESDTYPMLKDTVPQVLEGVSTMMNGAADALEEADQTVASNFAG
ncbi:MAG: WXG100 family type VII secretion target [Pseudobutyrivibrio sp.]|nr:WXG100 family type VII secretion target [Pseudobutyrivibrio sp.]